MVSSQPMDRFIACNQENWSGCRLTYLVTESPASSTFHAYPPTSLSNSYKSPAEALILLKAKQQSPVARSLSRPEQPNSPALTLIGKSLDQLGRTRVSQLDWTNVGPPMSRARDKRKTVPRIRRWSKVWCFIIYLGDILDLHWGLGPKASWCRGMAWA